MAFPKVDFRGDFLTMLRQAQVTPRDAPIQSRSSVQLMTCSICSRVSNTCSLRAPQSG
jgi:hypothetical protein